MTVLEMMDKWNRESGWTNAQRIEEAKGHARIAAGRGENNKELLEMITCLLDFAMADRPIEDFSAARLALASYKRNL